MERGPGGMPAGARRRQIQACPRGEQGQRCSIYIWRRRWGRAGERGARKKRSGAERGLAMGWVQPSAGCGETQWRPRWEEERAHLYRSAPWTDPAAGWPARTGCPCPGEPPATTNSGLSSAAHAGLGALARQLQARPRISGSDAAREPEERRPEGEGGYQEEGRSCPKGRFTELTPESSARRYSITDAASRLRAPAQEGGSSRRGPAPSGRAYANQLAAGAWPSGYHWTASLRPSEPPKTKFWGELRKPWSAEVHRLPGGCGGTGELVATSLPSVGACYSRLAQRLCQPSFSWGCATVRWAFSEDSTANTCATHPHRLKLSFITVQFLEKRKISFSTYLFVIKTVSQKWNVIPVKPVGGASSWQKRVLSFHNPHAFPMKNYVSSYCSFFCFLLARGLG